MRTNSNITKRMTSSCQLKRAHTQYSPISVKLQLVLSLYLHEPPQKPFLFWIYLTFLVLPWVYSASGAKTRQKKTEVRDDVRRVGVSIRSPVSIARLLCFDFRLYGSAGRDVDFLTLSSPVWSWKKADKRRQVRFWKRSRKISGDTGDAEAGCCYCCGIRAVCSGGHLGLVRYGRVYLKLGL